MRVNYREKYWKIKRWLAYQLQNREMTRAEIGEIVGVHPDTVGRWLKLDKNNLRGGRKQGDARSLTAEQEKKFTPYSWIRHRAN